MAQGGKVKKGGGSAKTSRKGGMRCEAFVDLLIESRLALEKPPGNFLSILFFIKSAPKRNQHIDKKDHVCFYDNHENETTTAYFL